MIQKKILPIFFLLLVIVSNKIYASEILWPSTANRRDIDMLIIGKVNAFRTKPLDTASQLGLSIESIRRIKNPSEIKVITEGAPTLYFNDILKKALYEHMQTLLSKGKLTHSSIYGSSPLNRAIDNGYDGVLVGESFIMLAFENYVSPITAVDLLLQCLFRDALINNSPEAAPLLFPGYTDLGTVLIEGVMDIDGRNLNVYILGLLFGLKKGATHAYTVVGRVGKDINEDGSLTPDEGIYNIKVELTGMAGGISTNWTWPDGAYIVSSINQRPHAVVFEGTNNFLVTKIVFDAFSKSFLLRYDVSVNNDKK